MNLHYLSLKAFKCFFPVFMLLCFSNSLIGQEQAEAENVSIISIKNDNSKAIFFYGGQQTFQKEQQGQTPLRSSSPSCIYFEDFDNGASSWNLSNSTDDETNCVDGNAGNSIKLKVSGQRVAVSPAIDLAANDCYRLTFDYWTPSFTECPAAINCERPDSGDEMHVEVSTSGEEGPWTRIATPAYTSGSKSTVEISLPCVTEATTLHIRFYQPFNGFVNTGGDCTEANEGVDNHLVDNICVQGSEIVCEDISVTLDPSTGLATIDPNSIIDDSNSMLCGDFVSATANPAQLSCEDLGLTSVAVTAFSSDECDDFTKTCTVNVDVTGLPCPFLLTEIGCTGDASYDIPTETFTVSASDCYAEFPYVTDENILVTGEVCGNSSITAYVSNINGNGTAGITMRESTAASSKKVEISTNGIDQLFKTIRINDNYPGFPQQVYSFDKYWLKIERTGFLFKASASVDNINYIPLIFQYIQMGECLEVGLFANTANGEDVTAQFTNVNISQENTEGLVGNIQNLNQSATTSNLRVFPNPTSDQITIDLGFYPENSTTLNVIDTNGRTIYQLSKEQLVDQKISINLGHLASGVYWIQVITDGQSPQLEKIIVR